MLGIGKDNTLFQGFGLFVFPGDDIVHQGAHWVFGWYTGYHGDLICIQPNITRELKGYELETALSPLCKSPFKAFIGFLFKYVLLKIDENLYDIRKSFK